MVFSMAFVFACAQCYPRRFFAFTVFLSLSLSRCLSLSFRSSHTFSRLQLGVMYKIYRGKRFFVRVFYFLTFFLLLLPLSVPWLWRWWLFLLLFFPLFAFNFSNSLVSSPHLHPFYFPMDKFIHTFSSPIFPSRCSCCCCLASCFHKRTFYVMG